MFGGVFTGDFADTCTNKFPHMSIGGRAEGLESAYPVARTPIGVSGNSICSLHCFLSLFISYYVLLLLGYYKINIWFYWWLNCNDKGDLSLFANKWDNFFYVEQTSVYQHFLIINPYPVSCLWFDIIHPNFWACYLPDCLKAFLSLVETKSNVLGKRYIQFKSTQTGFVSLDSN